MHNTAPEKHTDIINVVHPDNWITSSYASIYEYTRIRGIRESQIQAGAQPYVTYTASDTLADIVQRELDEKRCPLSIIRRVGDNTVEVIPANMLIMPTQIPITY
jgi:hypothetical protein